MTKAFALNFSLKALFFYGGERGCLNLLDSLFIIKTLFIIGDY